MTEDTPPSKTGDVRSGRSGTADRSDIDFDYALPVRALERLMKPVDPADEPYWAAVERLEREFEVSTDLGENIGRFDGSYFPDVSVRDYRTHRRFDLSNKSPGNVSKVVEARLRDGVTGTKGHQVRRLRFYQVPAPVAGPDASERERRFLRELFVATENAFAGDLVQCPEVLLETGDGDTIVGGPEDAERVRDQFETLRSEFDVEFGFLVDFALSTDLDAVVDTLPPGTVRKVRGHRGNLPAMSRYADSVESVAVYDR